MTENFKLSKSLYQVPEKTFSEALMDDKGTFESAHEAFEILFGSVLGITENTKVSDILQSDARYAFPEYIRRQVVDYINESLVFKDFFSSVQNYPSMESIESAIGKHRVLNMYRRLVSMSESAYTQMPLSVFSDIKLKSFAYEIVDRFIRTFTKEICGRESIRTRHYSIRSTEGSRIDRFMRMLPTCLDTQPTTLIVSYLLLQDLLAADLVKYEACWDNRNRHRYVGPNNIAVYRSKDLPNRNALLFDATTLAQCMTCTTAVDVNYSTLIDDKSLENVIVAWQLGMLSSFKLTSAIKLIEDTE